MSLLILIAIIAVVGLYIVMTYNKLVAGKNNTLAAESQIDVALKQRNDLIPNLVSTVKGYAKHEQETLTRVTELRQKAVALQDSDDLQQKDEVNAQLSQATTQLLAIAENYPDLKANEQFGQLMENLTNTENKIAYARQLYNTTAANFNTSLEQFPANLLVGLFKFTSFPLLVTPEAEKAVPTVNFD